jgi:ABC-type Fe3+ transport system substrate-binding protein
MNQRFILYAALVCVATGLGEEGRVVVISPHPSSIRHEFSRAFARWHEQRFGTPAAVEWRDLGGTADALRFVLSEFAAKPAGIGLDCFFGGGPEPALVLADRHLAQAYRLPAADLDGIPQSFNGVEVYDRDHQWYGAALSSFGILQNTRVQRLVHLPLARRWEDLADPRLRGWVGAGDPRNSGTMNNMFEAFLQAYGWERGWQLLTEISGNVTKFDRLSTTTAKEVTLGETAYGFTIDFFGFAQVAVAGRSNMVFVLPEDFTAISPDGITLLHGAPHPLTARRFLEFTLGEPGQRLWFLPRGHPEGARDYSIERMSVRPEFYRRYREVSNIAFSPFDLKQAFVYNAAVARQRREVVAALAGALLVDVHAELRSAWRAMIRRGLVPAERAELGRMPVTEAAARELAQGGWKGPELRNRKKTEWQSWARAKYRALARGGAPTVAAATDHAP